jgi:DNA-binding MarR family transcriptional regulator
MERPLTNKERELLAGLAEEPKRFKDLLGLEVFGNKGLSIALDRFAQLGYLKRGEDDGKYSLTERGQALLEQTKVESMVEADEDEDDLRLIQNTYRTIAIARCYDLLSELKFVVLRTFRKVNVEDRAELNDRLTLLRKLLVKHNPGIKEEELVKQEKKELGLSATEIVTAGFLWEKPLMKRGMKERYTHLLKLSSRFPDGEVKKEILESLAIFREVAGKLGDEKLEGLPIPSRT